MDELIDFDCLPEVGGDIQVTLAETGPVVEISTAVPVGFSSGIEVNDWRVIRDYVVEQIEKYHGRFPRNPAQESGIFKSFLSRWGDKAMPIARAAFEVHAGIWHNAPIRIQRFCTNSDPYFSCVIAANLE